MPGRQRKDLTGLVVGRLTVIEFAYRKKKRNYWRCQCTCGKTCIVRVDMLLSKKRPTNSCGCIKNEQIIESGKEYRFKPTHGDAFKRLYSIYRGILDRCNNPNATGYHNYGGRGIKCEWDTYEDFRADMEESYYKHVEEYGEEDTEIDRIDNDGNYCKDNCHWVTHREQCNNTRYTIYVVMEDGKEIPISDLARKLDIPVARLRKKYHRSEYDGTRKIPYDKLMGDE